MTSILFVCLGNICRSPLAEGVFLHLLAERGVTDAYRVDSAGTCDHHVGQPPDPRSVAVARRHGIDLPSRGRMVADGDFEAFDVIVGMDEANRRDLLRRCPRALEDRIRLLRDDDPEGAGDVPDPYYGGPSGFDDVYAMVRRSCEQLLARLEAS